MKSHVSLEQEVCLVCAKPFDTNVVLFDKRLRKSMDMHTVTGWGLCPEHQKLYDDGYVALVAADIDKSDKLPNGNIKPEGAYRLGPIAHIRFEAFDRTFNVSGVGKNGKRLPVLFVDSQVVEYLEKRVAADNPPPEA